MWKVYKYNGSMYEFEITKEKIIMLIDEEFAGERIREYSNVKMDIKAMVDEGMWSVIDNGV